MRRYLTAFVAMLALTAAMPGLFAQSRDDVYQDSDDEPSPPGDVPRSPGRPRPGDPPACTGSACPPTEVQVAQSLLSRGPDTSTVYEAFENFEHKFAVVGFVREGWPVTVEYVAEPDTVTFLRVKLYHQRRFLIFQIPFLEVAFEQNLDALPIEPGSGEPGHRTVLVRAVTLSAAADPAADPDPHVARFDIVSYRVADGQLLKENGKNVRAPVEVVGMAVGPRAVGSLTLRSGVLENTQIRIPLRGEPRPTVGYSYVTDDRRYDLLRVSLEQYRDDSLRWSFDREVAQPHAGGAQVTYRGSWEVTRRQRPGSYRMAISGWYTCGGVTITERLAECGDSPAWSVLHTGRMQLVQ